MLSTRLKRKNTKRTGKRNRKRAADKASRKGPMQGKQQKADPQTSKINDELTVFKADLTENKKDYNDSLDPAAYLIRQSPPSDHNPDTVAVYIVIGVEKENADYIFNNDDPLSGFDYNKPSIAEEIYNEFASVHETLYETMLSVASH